MVSKHVAHQLNSYRHHMVEGTGAPEPRPVDVNKLIESGRSGPLGSFSYGTPEVVAQRIRASTTGAPVETVFFWASVGGMPEDVVARNVQMICTRLAPLLNEPVRGCERHDPRTGFSVVKCTTDSRMTHR